MFLRTSYGQKMKKNISIILIFIQIMPPKRGQKFATKQSPATPGPSSVQPEDQAAAVSSGLVALLDTVFTGDR